MKINRILVKTESKTYPILVGDKLINNLPKILKKNNLKFKKCLIIIDKNIPTKYLSLLKYNLRNKKTFIYKFNSSEKNKNFQSVNFLLEILLKNNFNRDDLLISVGGGIIGDVSGFIANIFKRGIKFVNIPSTLLAQVDSSIGGKTGINNKYGKNLVGTFYQPNLVLSDISLLKSLPKREKICGYGEILKHSLISKKKIFIFLKKNYQNILDIKSPYIEKAIVDSCNIKKNIVQKDEKESGLRKILNLGHTFAHSFEAALNFSNKLNHGEAVLLGLKNEILFAYKKKIISKKDMLEIFDHLNSLDIKLDINNLFKKKDIEKILSFMKSDKKNFSQKINLILLQKINKPILNLQFSLKDIKGFLMKVLNN